MSIVSINLRPVQAPASVLQCLLCHESYRRGEVYTEHCPACLRGQAFADAARLAGDVKQLVDGSGPYECLTIAERREQLRELGIYTAPRKNAADAMPAGYIAVPRSDELVYVGGEAPDEQTRAEIELRDEIESMIDSYDYDFSGVQD